MLKFLVVVNYCTASLNETFQDKMSQIRTKIKNVDKDGGIVFFVEDEIMIDGKAKALEELKLLRKELHADTNTTTARGVGATLLQPLMWLVARDCGMPDEIEFIGAYLDTNILANALMTKSEFYKRKISVDMSLCVTSDESLSTLNAVKRIFAVNGIEMK